MTVYLVGGGPGDPDLLTVRAARLLARAEILVHDRLTTAAILSLAPPEALRVDVGKAAGRAPVPQSGINDLLVEHGRSGRCVVRLKGGDPYVFGRGGEEAQALAAAGVAYEVVPGLSSALAAPASAGIPVTMRECSSSFTVLTGHGDPRAGTAGTDGGVDWEAHARTDSTLVIMMGAATIGTIAARLVAGGRPADTPVAAIRWATTPRQVVLRSTLGEIGAHRLVPPCTIVVGDVAAMDLVDPTLPR